MWYWDLQRNGLIHNSYYIELLCHRLAKDVLEKPFLFISPPSLQNYIWGECCRNQLAWWNGRSFKDDRLMILFWLFVPLQLISDFTSITRKDWKMRNMSTALLGRKSIGSSIYVLLSWEFEFITLCLLNTVCSFSVWKLWR